jgi:hypothetical protein
METTTNNKRAARIAARLMYDHEAEVKASIPGWKEKLKAEIAESGYDPDADPLEVLLPIGYSGEIVEDVYKVMRELKEGRFVRSIYYTDIAQRLKLNLKYVHLILEILADNEYTEYGTSPRGSWLEPCGRALLELATEWRKDDGCYCPDCGEGLVFYSTKARCETCKKSIVPAPTTKPRTEGERRVTAWMKQPLPPGKTEDVYHDDDGIVIIKSLVKEPQP